MAKKSITIIFFIAIFIIQQGCKVKQQSFKVKEKHPIVLGNIVLNKEVDLKSSEFFKGFSELFYIEQGRMEGNIGEAVLSDPELQDRDATFHGRPISRNCFNKFSRGYFFFGFQPMENYQYYDTNFILKSEQKLLAGMFRYYAAMNKAPLNINEKIITGAELELCTYSFINSNLPCPDIIVSTEFSTRVKSYFEDQMFKKYGKPDKINFKSRELGEELTKVGDPVPLSDITYPEVGSLMYTWEKNGYKIVLIFDRAGPLFSDNILDPNFKKYESAKRTSGERDEFLMDIFKKKSSEGLFRIDLTNKSIISWDSYRGFIKYFLDDDIKKETESEIENKNRETEQKLKESREVY